jgi:hypothetical protein
MGDDWLPRSTRPSLILVLILVLISFALPLAAAEAHTTIRSFLGTWCVECHGPDKQKADRRFDELALPVAKLDTLIELQDIVDQLNLGEMPPKKAKQPPQTEVRRVVELLSQTIAEGRAQFASTGGSTVLRRLNRREYLNTVGDLFAMNMAAFDPTTKFPRDQTAEHMDNLGDVLRTSGYLLDQYLDAADAIVEKAFALQQRPEERTWQFDKNFQQQPELSYSHSRVFNYRYLCVYECMDSENHEGGYAPINGFQKGVPVDGIYEIKVLAHALHRNHPYDPDIFGTDAREPFRLGIVPGDATVGPLHHPQPLQPILAERVMGDGEPGWHTMKVWLDAGQTPRFVFPNGMRNCRQAFGRIAAKYKDHWPKDDPFKGGIVEARRIVLKHGQMPHIRIHEVRIRGPITEQWPPVTQQAVLGAKPFTPERPREILQTFASRAYRRPATKDEVDRLVAVAGARVKAGHTPLEGLKDGLKAALCSPAFLYLSNDTLDRSGGSPAADESQAIRGGKDAAAPLNAHALASRLSYFLWSTMPDAELLRLADNGALLNPDVLRAQLHRLLKDARSEAFIAGFLDSWLNLRSLGDMPPDRDAFHMFYTKNFQHAFKRETQLFMRDLLERNAGIVNFLDADYSFLNQALANLYGLGDIAKPAEAHEFRKVTFKHPNRGGLLGMGSVLTVTANGIETSPVTRGVWLLENILGTPPAPPPDNVPAIDPDVRGAKSVRDILTKHRDSPACFDCHQKIDPPGFALENFDPIGQWRTHYPAGRQRGPEIDATGQLPTGEEFRDVAGLKKILAQRRDQFARTLTERLLTYACGRRMEALDRPQVDAILAEVGRRGDGMRDLVELVVLNGTFRSR